MLPNAHASTDHTTKAKRAAGVLRLTFTCAMACFTLGAIEAAHAQSTPPTPQAEPAPSATPAPAAATTPPNPATPPAATAPAAAAAPAPWASTIKYSGEIDGGISGNFADPGDGLNFGQSTTDHANQASLNAVFLTVERDPNTSTSTFDWGFKVQGEFGSDVRYNRYLGEFNHQDMRYMGDVAQAYLTAHIGGLFAGGMDVTVGQFVTPLGDEVIDPRSNPFYSHSYIYSYGLPVDHTGGYVVAHPALADIYLGMDSGVNTTVSAGDNNGSASYLAGFGKTVGNWTVLVLSHFGPEDAGDNKHYRTYADGVITYKATSALTLTTELDFVNDAAYRATAYGATEYASYTLNSQTTLNGRVEVFNDENSFFVFNPTTDNGEITGQGITSPESSYRKATTYGEITVGATYSPPNLPGMLSTLELRPELRYDDALNGVHAYDDQSKSNQFTLAMDADLTF